MSRRSTLPFNLGVTAVAVAVVAVGLSVLATVGASDDDRPEFLYSLGTVLAFGFPYLAILAVGGAGYVLLLRLLRVRGRQTALLLAPAAALPGLLWAWVAGPSLGGVVTPLLFSIGVSALVRLEARQTPS